jgi:hypothetical protein
MQIDVGVAFACIPFDGASHDVYVTRLWWDAAFKPNRRLLNTLIFKIKM